MIKDKGFSGLNDYFFHSVGLWWQYLGRLRKSGPVGGIRSMGVGFENLKTQCHFQFVLLTSCFWFKI